MIRVRAVERLFFDAQKWRLVWTVRGLVGRSLVGRNEGEMVFGSVLDRYDLRC